MCFRPSIAFLSILVGALACTLDSQRVGDEPEPASTTPELCADACTRRVQCQLDVDETECFDMCESTNATDSICVDAREDHLACLLTLSCNDLETAEAEPDQGACAQTHAAQSQACS